MFGVLQPSQQCLDHVELVSYNLLTLSLGRLCPVSGQPVLCAILPPVTEPFLNQQKVENEHRNHFMSSSMQVMWTIWDSNLCSLALQSEPQPTALWRQTITLLKVKIFFLQPCSHRVEPTPHSAHVLDTALKGKVPPSPLAGLNLS